MKKKTDEIQLTSWMLRMGIVYINISSNTTYQVVKIIVENRGRGQTEGRNYDFISGCSENASLMR